MKNSENAIVRRDQRALLIVSSLSKNYTGLWKALYTVLEVAGVAIARFLLCKQYQVVVTKLTSDATKDEFLDALDTIARLPGIVAVDVFIHLHGLPGTFSFHDGDVSSAVIRDDILALELPAQRLRLLYNTGCWGDSQNWRDMLAAGFAATIGSKKVNASGAIELPVFCGLWRRGVGALQAVRMADHRVPREMQDVFARLVLPADRARDVDSEKFVRGAGGITISGAHAQTSDTMFR